MLLLPVFLFQFALSAPTPISVTGLLPDDVAAAVRQQVLLDYKNISLGAQVHGHAVKIPHIHIDQQDEQNIFAVQSIREAALSQVQLQVVRAQESQEQLNRRLRSGRYTEEFLLDYAQTSGSQTASVVQEVSSTMQPYTSTLRHAIGNFLVAPFLQSVTIGSQLYNAGIHRTAHPDYETRISAHNMTSNYNQLAQMAMTASLDYSQLMSNTQQIVSLLKL